MDLTSFFILLLALAAYGILHSLVASLRLKSLARLVCGDLVERWYRLFFTLFALFSFLPVLALFVSLPDSRLYALPLPWSLLFIALQALGVLLFAWALLVTDLWAFIGLRQLSPSGEPAEKLVVHGPYRWVRHPLYSASLLVLWFSPLMSLNLLAFNLGVTAYFVIGGVFEERKLLRQFGPAYAAYRARTPMLIPLRFPES